MTEKDEFEEQYIDTLKKADIIADSPVEGTVILKAYGCKIWEQIKKAIGKKLEALGYEDMYFPMLIPRSLMEKQEEHYESFAREAVFCTKVGEKKLGDELIIRPTSETIIYPSIREWVKTEKDLPLKINQWCNIMRWEILKPTFPLIRNNEFLWHECHSLHATKEECDKEAKLLHDVYKELFKEQLAVDFFEGKKPERRKFAGAEYTLALEGMMNNRKCVQLATSHSLGQKFSRAFNIKFMKKGKEEFAWIACAGLTTRVIGILAMTHGDKKGLVLPPKIAPYQVAVVEDELLYSKLKDRFRVCKGKNPGHWIAKGIPLIITGSRLIRRDTFEETKIEENAEKQLNALLESIQSNLLKRAADFRRKHTYRTDDYETFKDVLLNRKGTAEAGWCGEEECSKKIKDETKGSLRVISEADSSQKCIRCKKKAGYTGIFGQAY